MTNFIDQFQYFSSQLIKWYEINKRALPWRDTTDPYKIWLSEIILQQTKVTQGLDYYLKFIQNYPTVDALANANEEEILKDWQGLGYYSRARNLHYSAKHISVQLKGNFPSTYSEIIQLKGVGDYTASAISSFVFNEKNAVVDGNVYRVLARYYGISTPINSSEGIKEFKKIAQNIIPESDPGKYNQAIMEFGALQCTPKNPQCTICPIAENCIAFLNKQIENLPYKKGKVKIKTLYYYYFVIEDGLNILMNKRDSKGIWQNLYDFPLIESEVEILDLKQLEKRLQSKYQFENKFKIKQITPARKHLLSHRRIYASFIYIKSKTPIPLYNSNLNLTPLERIEEYPIPKLIENYLREETNLLHL